MTSTAIPTITKDDPSFKPWTIPVRALSVFYGTPQISRLSHYFLPSILSNGERVLYLDGANQIDPLLIARFARERGRDASDFNSLVRVARAFTCFQLTSLIERASQFLTKFAASIVIVSALPDIYFDEDIRDGEARASFEHALEGLCHLVQQPLSVVVFSDAISFPTQRRIFFQRLIAQADGVTRVETQADNKISFISEKARPLLVV